MPERKDCTNMLSRIKSHGLNGIGGFAVQVETDIANGLPGFEIVGLPDAAVKESRERVRAADSDVVTVAYSIAQKSSKFGRGERG